MSYGDLRLALADLAFIMKPSLMAGLKTAAKGSALAICSNTMIKRGSQIWKNFQEPVESCCALGPEDNFRHYRNYKRIDDGIMDIKGE